MRHRRLLFVSLIASLTISALLGVASASAYETALCSKSEMPCSAKNVLPAGTLIGAGVAPAYEETNFVVENAGSKWSCDYVLLGAETTAAAGSPLPGQNESYLNGSLCHAGKNGESSCTTATLTVPTNVSIATWGTPGVGAITFNGAAKEPFSVAFSCGLGITCKFGKSAVTMFYDANSLAGLIPSTTLNLESGPSVLCGSSAQLSSVLSTVGPAISRI